MTTKEMREPTFLILTALAGGRKHGYALIAEAEKLSDGRVQLKVGTLYAALDRLSDEGLVAHAGDEITQGRARRYFELTPRGREELTAVADRTARIAAEAHRRLTQLLPAAPTIVRGKAAGGGLPIGGTA